MCVRWKDGWVRLGWWRQEIHLGFASLKSDKEDWRWLVLEGGDIRMFIIISTFKIS